MLSSKVKHAILKRMDVNAINIYATFRDLLKNHPYSLETMDYDAYWSQRPDYSMQPRFPLIAKSIRQQSSVLDVGCGDGALLAYLQQTRQIQALGIDISRVAIQRAAARGVSARVQTLQDLAATTTTPFDYVVMSEVIEHVPDPEDFVHLGASLARFALILTFPNIAYWPHRLRLLSGRFPIQWAYHPGEHLRFWSLPDFVFWLRQLPVTSQVPRFDVQASNGLTWFGLHQKLPNLFGNQIIVVIPLQPGIRHNSLPL